MHELQVLAEDLVVRGSPHPQPALQQHLLRGGEGGRRGGVRGGRWWVGGGVSEGGCERVGGRGVSERV